MITLLRWFGRLVARLFEWARPCHSPLRKSLASLHSNPTPAAQFSRKRNSLGLGPLGNPVARPSASFAVQPCAGVIRGRTISTLDSGTRLVFDLSQLTR